MAAKAKFCPFCGSIECSLRNAQLKPKATVETLTEAPSSFTMKFIYFGGIAAILYIVFSSYKKYRYPKKKAMLP